ncbi:isoprenylcysteine carboxylmethyltransferase family protein [Enterococcus sp.]|uniref:methyltransferase family protein n=1 Tax=Enterococcus sp. TaxID=35783 RepID=UPI0029098765|nr:isoprenylcysteine carboxylmethyltransferase family protein [Enterococcus sp.]MDU5333930.1 isoprenylcysteine carboxylmethyltransferase family protein [Enterococcus sp.]
MLVRVLAFTAVTLFYLIYLVKGLLLRKQGITVNLLGKDAKKEQYFEIVLRIMTGVGGVLQFLAPLLFDINRTVWVHVGLGLIFAGVFLFFIAVRAMGLNWRAGYNEEQKTELVTTGIYRFSRNPAFVAFDLLYLGLAVIFPNILMIAAAILALVLFDRQIRGEEAYLMSTFAENYRQYQSEVRRYL